MNNLINGFNNINTYSNIPITQFYASSLPVQNLSISDDDKVKYEKYFYQMNPINGYIDGSTAKQFFIKSGLPTMVLASIWDLADINKDGMLDKTEFFIAMHLITIKKAGQNIPVMKSYNNVDSNQQTLIAHNGNNCDTTINLFNSQLDWLIPLPNRIRYQQTFKQNDVNNLGYLNGSQAKNIFLKTQLPQNILAQIWNLSDLNCDGSLELEEFILASYLAEEYKSGNLPKMYDVLPPTLIPPKYRRKRSITSPSHNAPPPPPLANTDSPPQKSQMMKQATFEEKRRENFDKGAAILEQKREALIRAEAAERAERQRRESLELESKRLIVMEQEKKRVLDYEKMLEKQKEAEKSNDMEKINFYMAKEEARKELDQRLKQDMLDNKIKELMHTIKAEKEILCRLKAREKDLDCDIQNMEEKILNVKQTHTETLNVSNKLKESKDVLLKLSDDKLTSIQTLQSQLQNFESRLNNEVKEKAKCKDTLASFGFGSRDNLLDAEKDLSHSQIDIITPATQEENEFKRIQVLSSISESKRNTEVVVPLPNDGFGFESFGDDFSLSTNTIHSKNIPSSNVEHIPPTMLNISKTVKNTLESCLNSPIKSPPSIKSVNSSNKVSLASTSSVMVNKSVKSLTSDLNNKLILHDSPKHSFTLTKETLPPTSPKSPDFKSIQISDKSKITNNNTHTGGVTEPTQLYPYKAIFPFEARSEDELSFNMGDVIMVAESEICEEGWLGGKIGDKIGWFPSSYAVKIESALNTNSPTTKIPLYPELQQLTTQGGNNFTVKHQHEAKPIKALAIFSLCTKIEGDLSFDKGDIITIEKELDENWWIASLKENKGYVPKSYVKIIGNSETIAVDASSANNSPFNSSRPMSSSAINFEPQTNTKQNNKDSLWSSSRSESSIAADGYQPPVSTIDPFTNTTFQANSNNIDNVTNVIGKSITTSSLGFESTFTTSTTKDANQTYVAMFPFSSQEPGDLDLKVGDMVLLDPSQSDTDWWKGTNLSTNLTGIFPKNYVKKAALINTEQELKNRSQTTTPSSNKVRSQSIASVTSLGSSGAGNVKSNLYVAIAPFTATGAEQLTLVPGAIITLRRKTPAGWWEGEIIQTQKLAGESKSKRQLGWFPGTHVKPYNADDTPISKSPNILTTNDLPSLTTKGGKPPPSFSTPVMVKALFDYDSSHTGDLNFKKGDLIQITDKSSDPSWWTGINVDTKQTGLFPSNYVSPC